MRNYRGTLPSLILSSPSYILHVNRSSVTCYLRDSALLPESGPDYKGTLIERPESGPGKGVMFERLSQCLEILSANPPNLPEALIRRCARY